MIEKLYTAQEVADCLGCSLQTVYELVRSGELPSLKVRSSWRVRESDLEKYILGGGSRDGGNGVTPIRAGVRNAS